LSPVIRDHYANDRHKSLAGKSALGTMHSRLDPLPAG
jgi:hypothetical protein